MTTITIEAGDLERVAAALTPEAAERVRRLADKLFLGHEFLNWLYFAVTNEDGLVVDFDGIARDAGFGEHAAPDEPVLLLAIGKSATLFDMGSNLTVALRGSALNDKGEILQTLRSGGAFRALAIDLSIAQRVYALTLDNTGVVSGLKLPDLFTDPNEDDAGAAPVDPLTPKKKAARPKLPTEDVLALRLTCLDEVDRVVAALFGEFLRRTVDAGERANDLATIRAEIVSGLASRAVNA